MKIQTSNLIYTHKVSVIIVTFNSESFIYSTLKRITEPPISHLEVIVVDNNSTDETVKIIQSNFTDVILIRNSVNLGFAQGVKIGAAKAKGDYYCLINPDLEITVEQCMQLVERLHFTPGAGIISPKVVGTKRKMRIISAGHFPTLWRIFTHYSGISRIFLNLKFFEGHYLFENQVHDLHEVDWVSGASFIIKRQVWNLVCGFSTRWFMYAEDIDLCFRVKQKKHKVFVDSDVNVEHFVGGSSRKLEEGVDSSWILNLFEFYQIAYTPNFLCRVLWKSIFAVGLTSRSAYFAVVANRSGEEGQEWKLESIKFRNYARSILFAPSIRDNG
jgi:GT2 family glycosyltransferase